MHIGEPTLTHCQENQEYEFLRLVSGNRGNRKLDDLVTEFNTTHNCSSSLSSLKKRLTRIGEKYGQAKMLSAGLKYCPGWEEEDSR
jgi:hypothetical protein